MGKTKQYKDKKAAQVAKYWRNIKGIEGITPKEKELLLKKLTKEWEEIRDYPKDKLPNIKGLKGLLNAFH